MKETKSKPNVSIRIDKDILHKARVAAVTNKKTLGKWLEEAIKGQITKEKRREARAKKKIAREKDKKRVDKEKGKGKTVKEVAQGDKNDKVK
ncbi:hypothetical protein ACFLXO_07520 [Chloroflexota bacterium]